MFKKVDALFEGLHLRLQGPVLGPEGGLLFGQLGEPLPGRFVLLSQSVEGGDLRLQRLVLLTGLRQDQSGFQFLDLLGDPLFLFLQRVAGLPDLVPKRIPPLVQLGQRGEFLAQRPFLLQGLLVGGEPLFDLLRLGQDLLVLGQTGLPLLPFLLKGGPLPLGLGDPAGCLFHLGADVTEFRPGGLHRLPRFLGFLEGRAQFHHLRLGGVDLCLVLGSSGQFRLDLSQPDLQKVQFLLDRPEPLLDSLLIDRPDVQPQDLPQHPLPFRGGLDRELVGAALAEEG